LLYVHAVLSAFLPKNITLHFGVSSNLKSNHVFAACLSLSQIVMVDTILQIDKSQYWAALVSLKSSCHWITFVQMDS